MIQDKTEHSILTNFTIVGFLTLRRTQASNWMKKMTVANQSEKVKPVAYQYKMSQPVALPESAPSKRTPSPQDLVIGGMKEWRKQN